MSNGHNQFISKGSDLSFEDALLTVIRSKGTKLVLSAGYVTKADEVTEIYKNIKIALEKNKKLQVEVYIGVFDSEYSTKEKIIELHEKHIPNNFLSIEEAERIQVYGIKEFHAKCYLMIDTKRDQVPIGVCGIMGSSNISMPTLSQGPRIEFDLFMKDGSGNLLLQSFTKEIEKVLENAKKGENSNIVEIRDRIYSTPYYKMLDYDNDMECKRDTIKEAAKQESELHSGLHE